MTERPYSSAGIEPGTLYVIIDYGTGAETGQYGATPDGIGMHWYDTREAAIADRLDFPEDPPEVELTDMELDQLRNGEGHTGHQTNTGWWCDTCDSPYCENA